MAFEFFDKAKEIMGKLESTQAENIHNAALLISESIRNGGILQAFGSGHSYAGAIEVCGRAGGLIPSKVVRDYSEGIFESVEGNAYFLMRQVDVQDAPLVPNFYPLHYKNIRGWHGLGLHTVRSISYGEERIVWHFRTSIDTQ